MEGVDTKIQRAILDMILYSTAVFRVAKTHFECKIIILTLGPGIILELGDSVLSESFLVSSVLLERISESRVQLKSM